MGNKYYTLQCCENLINKCVKADYDYEVFNEGCLGLGKRLLYKNNANCFLIEEEFLNSWSSIHRVDKFWGEGVVESTISRYKVYGGSYKELKDGYIIFAKGYKTTIAKRVKIGDYNCYTIKKYNKTPQKYINYVK